MTRSTVHPKLTRRERALVAAILEGLTNRQMAGRFGTSEQTVKNQLSVLYEKFGVSSRLQLAVAVMRRGVVKPPDA